MSISLFFVHTVSVETSAGSGPYGETFLPPVDVACFVDDEQDVTVQGTTVAVSDATKIYAPLSAAPDSPPTGGQFATDSKVTINGQVCRVVNVKRRDGGTLGLPDHVEVTVK